MKISYLDKNDFEEWDKFVEESPQGSIFSQTWYLDALQVEYRILCVIENDKILAGIVLAKNEIRTFSNPMLDKYLGVLFFDRQNDTQKTIAKQYKILELLIDELKKYKSFDYFFHPRFTNWIPFYWHEFSQQTRYTYRLNLSNSVEKIFENFHGNLKNDIRNALKNKVEIKSDISFDTLFGVINKTFLRQGSKAPFSREKLKVFIEKMSDKDKFKSFGAFDEKNNIISVCGLVYDNKASYLLLNGIDIDNQVRGANALMIFETIKYFRNKVQLYDFEGSMLKGVEQFYRRFGGELTPYMRIWNDNFLNYIKYKVKKIYKKLRYGR